MSEPRFVPVPVAHPTPAGRAKTEPGIAPGRHIGRPSKLTRELEERLLTSLRSTGNLKLACAYVGISYNTVDAWVKRGRGKIAGRPPTPEYVKFARLVDENKAAAQIYATANLLALSSKSPRAAVNYLDVYGDEEWKGPRREIREGSDLPALPSPTAPPTAINVTPTVNVAVGIDAREQHLTVIEIDDDRMPEFLRSLIAQTRADRAAILAANESDQPDEQVPDGHRSPRLTPLRTSSANS